MLTVRVRSTLHARGWRIQLTWCDRDGTGARSWHRVVDPHGAEQWCTAGQLRPLLARHGIEIRDLTLTDFAAHRIQPDRR